MNEKHKESKAKYNEIKYTEQANTAKQYIRNLSDIKLNNDEIIVLAKGLKFVPTPNIRHWDLIHDFTKFERLMRLQYEYHDATKIMHPFRSNQHMNHHVDQ